MFRFKSKGSFKFIERFINDVKSQKYLDPIDKCAIKGVRALSEATPKDTGVTAASWNYEVHKSASGVKIYWTNDNFNRDCNIAILIQYGHGTGRGAYVQGIDYINPALKPIFDEIANEVWKEVTKS